MRAAHLACAIACLCLLASAAAAEEPSLEIVSPRAGTTYDGQVDASLLLRNLPARRVLVRVHFGEITHGFVVDPHLDPPETTSDGTPTWPVTDAWLYLKEGPHEVEIVVFYADQPDEELLRESVAFQIEGASGAAPPTHVGFYGCRNLVALERVVSEWRAAGLRDPAARAVLDDLTGRLLLARARAWANELDALNGLHLHYVRSLSYDKALAVLHRGERLVAQMDSHLRAHSGPETAQEHMAWRRWESSHQQYLRLVTDMHARLGRLEDTMEAARHEVGTAEAGLERASSDLDRMLARSALKTAYSRKATFHMLLTGDEEAYDEWKTRWRELSASSQD